MQHHVYFWLKPERLNEDDRKTFENSLDKLSAIPLIQSAGWGKPAPTPKRPVIEDSYTYGAYQTFASVADHAAYQVHEDHIEFIEKHKEWWEKVQIMDVE